MGQIQNLFPKFYYHGHVERHDELKRVLLSESTSAKLTQPKEWNCSVKSSFETDTNKEDFSWDLFFECIKDNVLEMHNQLHGQVFSEVWLSEAWINVYSKGDSQEVHTHVGGSDSTFGCAYFLQYDKEKDAQFVFYDPNQEKHLGNYSKHYPVENTWFPDVSEGDIIIFPAYLHHQVEPQRSDTKRITVAANLGIKKRLAL